MHHSNAFSLLFALFTCLQAFSQGNTYLSNNPVWQITSTCNTGGYCIQQENYNYFTGGDTLLGLHQYKMIFRKGEGSYFWMSSPPVPPGCSGTYWYVNPQPSFFMRSAGKQMFIRELSDTTERLLYDFDLEAGDTLPLTYNNFSTGITVTLVDSFLTPQGYRKKFSLSGNTWSQFLLEGIGHDLGLTEPMQVPLECGYQMLCFSLNDTACWPASGPGCDMAVGMPGSIPAASFRFTPNPATSLISLQTNRPAQDATIIILSCSGQCIREMHHVNTCAQTLDCSDLRPGLYLFVLIVDGNVAFREKVIIQ